MAHKPDTVNPYGAGGGASAAPHASADASTPPPYPQGTSAEQIREDIARTRAEMDHTVDALQERLRPRHLLDDVLDWFRQPSSDGGTSGAADTAKDIGRKVMDKLKQHPVPAALIGAGVTWLLFEGDSQGMTRGDYEARKWDLPSYSGSYVDARTGKPYDAGYGDDAQRPDGGSGGAGAPCPPGTTAIPTAGEFGQSAPQGPGITEKARDALSGAARSVRDSASSMAHTMRDSASSAGRSVRGYASAASDKLERGYDAGRHYLERGIEEYPLAMGAAAMALGVLGGLLLPHTRTEDRWMGEEADELKRRAKDAGQETLERGKQVAAAATNAAADEVSRQDAGPDSLVEKVKHVAHDVKDAAGESARREGIDPDSLAQKGRNVVERAKDAAKDEARRQSDRPS